MKGFYFPSAAILEGNQFLNRANENSVSTTSLSILAAQGNGYRDRAVCPP